MNMVLEIPDEVAASLPEAERKQFLLLELACALYGREIISLGQGGLMTGLSRFDFSREVGLRKIPRQYDLHDLEVDAAYARR